MAMAVTELLALKEQLENRRANKQPKKGPKYDPRQRSLANTFRAFRGCLKNLRQRPEVGKDLASLLSKAVTDAYQRKSSKKARYRPPNPDKKPLGDPEIRRLSPDENKKLKRWECKNAA